jgi:hypothetical protein
MKKVTKLQPNDFSCDMYNTEEDYFYGKDCMKKVEYRIVHNSTPIARQDLFSNLGKHISVLSRNQFCLLLTSEQT